MKCFTIMFLCQYIFSNVEWVVSFHSNGPKDQRCKREEPGSDGVTERKATIQGSSCRVAQSPHAFFVARHANHHYVSVARGHAPRGQHTGGSSPETKPKVPWRCTRRRTSWRSWGCKTRRTATQRPCYPKGAKNSRIRVSVLIRQHPHHSICSVHHSIEHKRDTCYTLTCL